MPLGLGDLNKKKRPAANKVGGSSNVMGGGLAAPLKSPSNSWASRTARPWDTAGLQKSSRGRRSLVVEDASMSEEWLSIQAVPFFWIDLSEFSFLTRASLAVIAFEETLQERLVRPMAAIRRLCSGE